MRSTEKQTAAASILPATDRESGVPLYLQLAAAMRQRIHRDDLVPGTPVALGVPLAYYWELPRLRRCSERF
jgi:hypothetical protein